MFYYIYILHGPLKGTIFPLTASHYFISLYKNKSEDINADSAVLHIPCYEEVEEKMLSITLDKSNVKNNKIKIENSKIADEIGKKFQLEIDKVFYLNDIPVFLISNKDNSPLSSIHLKKTKKISKNKKITVGTLLLIMLTLISFFLFMSPSPISPIEVKKIALNSLEDLNLKGFNGKNNYYCIYDDTFSEWRKKYQINSNIIYIDIKNIKSSLNNKIYNLTLKNKQKPIINFIYHNENEKISIIKIINKSFPSNCQANINRFSLPKIIDEINKFSFTQSIGYTIQEKKNGIIFIFDEKLTSGNKSILDNYIKKQTSIFGRKFIFYNENIDDIYLKNKSILQEDKGYIFINNQHRYFPQGL
ncbi:PrgH/EprH family type III secretion apparatus protein [Proteus hauseri]|uniref:PrgH/EprH family type III secretion apparatus protein n=1 Tax=Proteus hauseri TaxID=183417 RepID=UPI001009702B|nr:PrgH/EprH family type III secretion apparatus protein [Proteus hauseri]QAV22741.1 hypothetical protein PH4a_05030 [Proteus hauseri]